MQDNKSISRDGTDKQNLPYSLGRFWPLWELKAISGWPLLAASVVKGLNIYMGGGGGADLNLPSLSSMTVLLNNSLTFFILLLFRAK